MADYESGLPIRSEADGADERVQTKIVDASNPDTQQMEVDTDNNAHVEVHGNKPDNSDVVIQLSEEGRPNPNGDYDGTTNTKPASTATILHDRATTPTETGQNFRPTGVQGTDDDTVHAMDMALHDESGNAYTANNPLPVYLSESEGDEVADYDTAAAIAKDATDNHDYTVTALKTLVIDRILATASGKAKIELQIETGVATDTWTSKAVAFNSTANPNMVLEIGKKLTVAAGVRVRIIRTNRDNQAQDLYSTILGIEKD